MNNVSEEPPCLTFFIFINSSNYDQVIGPLERRRQPDHDGLPTWNFNQSKWCFLRLKRPHRRTRHLVELEVKSSVIGIGVVIRKLFDKNIFFFDFGSTHLKFDPPLETLP